MMMFKSLRMASPICIIFTAMTVSALVTVGAGEQSEIQPHERQKRDLLFGLCYFMEVYTRRSCLDYLSYGCFCGAGNAGEDVEPKDSVDRCCKVHDECYGRAESRCRMKPHHVPYLRLCYKGCYCASTRWNSYCQYYTCNCDLDFARCLRRASFSSYYKNYNRKRC